MADDTKTPEPRYAPWEFTDEGAADEAEYPIPIDHSTNRYQMTQAQDFLLRIEADAVCTGGRISRADFADDDWRRLAAWSRLGFLRVRPKAEHRSIYARDVDSSFGSYTHSVVFSPEAWRTASALRRERGHRNFCECESVEYQRMKRRDPESQRESHASYGVAVLTRSIRSHGASLFGSAIKHQTTLSLTLHEATALRREGHFCESHIHPGRVLLEVELSPSQWGELTASVGCGDGTPCTFRYREHGAVDDCPWQPEGGKLTGDIKTLLQGVIPDQVQEALDALSKLTAPGAKVRKADVQAIEDAVRQAVSGVESALPFAFERVVEYIEKARDSAMRELSAYGRRTLPEGKDTGDIIKAKALGLLPGEEKE